MSTVVQAPRRRTGTRRTRRRDTEPPGRSILKGLTVTAAIAAVLWLAVTAYNGVPFRHYTSMYVTIPQAGNLLEHDPIRIAGVRVGQVLSKSINRDGRILLALQLEPGVTLPADTKVELRASGLLGARYVELIPGSSSRLLPAGSTIQAPTTALTYGVPEALNTFDAQTRGGLGTMVRELGAGLLGRGRALNDAIGVSAAHMVPFEQLAETILARPGAAQRLLPSLDQMTTALANAGGQIASTFGPAASAFAPFVDHRTAVQATLDQAPGALDAANSGLAEGQQLLSATRALADAARVTLPYAPGGLQQASALLRDSHTPLLRARSLLDAARPAVPAALRITTSVKPLLGPLSQQLNNLIPIVGQLTPYGCNVINLAAVFRSMTGFGGTGTGPNGPAMAFRLTVVPPGGAAFFGARDTAGLTARDGYPPPCKYLASRYPTPGTHSATGRAVP